MAGAEKPADVFTASYVDMGEHLEELTHWSPRMKGRRQPKGYDLHRGPHIDSVGIRDIVDGQTHNFAVDKDVDANVLVIQVHRGQIQVKSAGKEMEFTGPIHSAAGTLNHESKLSWNGKQLFIHNGYDTTVTASNPGGALISWTHFVHNPSGTWVPQAEVREIR